MKKFTMGYVTTRLMHKKSKKKEIEIDGDDGALMVHQGKMNNTFWRKDIKTCYYCAQWATLDISLLEYAFVM